MERSSNWLLVLLTLTWITSEGILAWKPITTSGGGSPSTTLYSLKQSHPGTGATASVSVSLDTASIAGGGGGGGVGVGGGSLSSSSGATTSSSEEYGIEAASSYSQFGQDNGDDLLLSRAAAEAAAQPIRFDASDEHQYESYGLEHHHHHHDHLHDDDISKATSLGFTRTPLYGSDRCSVKKFAFNQDGVVQYGNELPELDQFTVCFWMRFTNHTGDHVLFTYEAEKEPREIQIWVANAQNSSFLSMAIKGQQMYRLNYPLRMRQWHHMCSSWNGKTGEWQVWLKAERIGRGFHNSLVGKTIPANGKLRSGGASVTGDVSHGLHFEMTLVQIYRVALSAGKAHRDHKHHHAHHFDHEGQEVSSTMRPPPTINRPQSMHMLLASGQIPTRVRINLANPTNGGGAATATATGGTVPATVGAAPGQQAITINTNFVNGQINAGSRLVAQQLIGLPHTQRIAIPRRPGSSSSSSSSTSTSTSNTGQFQMLSNSANVQFIDETETRIQFKRNAVIPNAATGAATTGGAAVNNKKVQKRGLVLLDDGSVVDDGSDDYTKYNGLADFGGQQFKHELGLKMSLEEEVSTHDREPAEEEVRAVMGVCSTCDAEPFQGAIVFAWKDVTEHMNNALKGLSVGNCGNF